MTDVKLAAPTSTPIQAPAPVSAQAAASTGNAPAEAADNKDIKAGSPFMNALAKQIQGLAASGSESVGAAGAVTELLKTAAGEGVSDSAAANTGGAELPLTGQALPLDPSLLASLPTGTVPTGTENNIKNDDQLLNRLVKQMQTQDVTGAESAGTPVVVPELLKPAASEGASDGDADNQGVSALPMPDQALSIDPGLLAIVSAVADPTVNDAAALLLGAGQGNALSAARPNLNLTPVATAVAQGAAAPDSAVIPGLLAAAAPQQTPFARASIDTLASESASQTFSLSAASAAPDSPAPVFAVTSPVAATSSIGLSSALPVITVPLAQPGWDQALGQRVQWMVSQQMQGAELRITPPHLGPMEVRISIGQDQQTTINFTSPHGVVRDAIEAALPRLRDMLGDTGMNQVNVNVSQHSFAEQRRQAMPQGGARDAAYASGLDVSGVEGVSGAVMSGRAGVGLVDYFA